MTHRNSSMILSALCLSVALIGTGCDDSGSGGAGPTGGNAHGTLIDACTLLTMEEAAAILGKPVLSVKADTSQKIITCDWNGSVEPGKILPSQISISAFTPDGFAADHKSTV